MISMTVQGMSCASCVRSITNVIHSQDAKAVVRVDLPQKEVQVSSTVISAEDIAAAIKNAGYQVSGVKTLPE